MSEIKGQLLGLLLVLAVFGVVKTVAVTMFQKTAESISSKVDQEVAAKIALSAPGAFEIAL
jgi:anionic cell wall polymer biosynthesis LytR-Cps2A-Psr (LCP) family protein